MTTEFAVIFSDQRNQNFNCSGPHRSISGLKGSVCGLVQPTGAVPDVVSYFFRRLGARAEHIHDADDLLRGEAPRVDHLIPASIGIHFAPLGGVLWRHDGIRP